MFFISVPGKDRKPTRLHKGDRVRWIASRRSLKFYRPKYFRNGDPEALRQQNGSETCFIPWLVKYGDPIGVLDIIASAAGLSCKIIFNSGEDEKVFEFI